MKVSPLVLTLVCIATIASCAKSPPPPVHDVAADEAAIRGLTETFLKAYNAGDVEGTVVNTMDDAVQMRPDGPELVGKAAILAAQQKNFAENTLTQAAKVEEVAVFGDVGMSRGTWQVTATPKAGKGKATTTNGKFIVIQRRQADGSWKAWRHMWNEDRSAPVAK